MHDSNAWQFINYLKPQLPTGGPDFGICRNQIPMLVLLAGT